MDQSPQDTKVKVIISEVYLREGVYEGHQYFQMIAKTSDGVTLKARLTEFEYRIMKENYAVAD